MNTWGARSQRERATSDARLNEVGDIVLEIKNHSVLKGHRDQYDQHAAFTSDPQRSKLDWPDGKHNELPSKAQDVRTYPNPPTSSLAEDFAALEKYDSSPLFKRVLETLRAQPLREDQLYLLGLYKGVSHMLGYKFRTGADWDRDGEIADNGFEDFFHVEVED